MEPSPNPLHAAKLSEKEERFRAYVRNQVVRKLGYLNANLNKTRQEIDRANKSILLGRISKMKRNEIEYWENYVERLSKKERIIESEIRTYMRMEEEIYLCCSDEIRNFFLEVGAKLQNAMPDAELDDIYSALVMTAYSLLGEFSDDMLSIQNLGDNAFRLYMQINGGDIMYNDENLSSQIRRFLLGFRNENEVGGRARRTKTKGNRKTRKYTRKHKKTRRVCARQRR